MVAESVCDTAAIALAAVYPLNQRVTYYLNGLKFSKKPLF
jgi:hypothetical protein